MATTTVVDTVAPRNFNNGTVTRASRTLPANFQSVTFQLDPTTGNVSAPFTGFANPFNSTSMEITFGMQWSWDGGVTFPGSTQATITGSPTGTWGTTKLGQPQMTPSVTLSMPFDSNLGGSPNAYRAFATLVNGPVTTGLTVSETTTV